ncbi:MAG: flagellin, partial [Armatimonadota bacterium]
MRIANKSYLDLLQQGIRNAEGDLGVLTEQISSGRRINRPSDDPVAMGKTVRAHATLDAVLSRNRTLKWASAINNATDGALGELTKPLQTALDAGMRATQVGIGEAGRLACAEEIRAAMDRVVTIGNSEFSSVYLFAGTKNRQPPLNTAGAGADPVAYSGNSTPMEVNVAPGRSVELTISGQRLFNFEDAVGERAVEGVDSDIFQTMSDLADAIENGDVEGITEHSDDLKALQDHIVAERGRLGASGLRLEQSVALTEDVELQCREILAEVEDVDMIKALTEVQQRKTGYQAALAATSMISNMPT